MARFAGLLVLLWLIATPAAAQWQREFAQAAKVRDMKNATAAIKDKPFEQVFRFGRGLQMDIANDKNKALAADVFKMLKLLVPKTHGSRALDGLAKLCAAKGSGYQAWLMEIDKRIRPLIPTINKGIRGEPEAGVAAAPELLSIAKACEEYGEMERAAYFYKLLVLVTNRLGKKAPAGSFKAGVEGRERTRRAWDLPIERLDRQLKEQAKSGEGVQPTGPQTRLVWAPGSKWQRQQGKFKVWKKPFVGVGQFTGSHPVLWQMIEMQGQFEAEKFNKEQFRQGITGGGRFTLPRGMSLIRTMNPRPLILRLNATTFGIDCDYDGKPEGTFKLKGKPVTVVFEREVDGEKRKQALAFWGPANEKIGKTTLNMSSDDRRAIMTYRGATCMEVTVDGAKLVFIDENGSGGFGDTPRLTGSPRTQPYGQMVCDSMILPGDKKVLPFSDFIPINGNYYKFKFSGETVKYRKLDMSRIPMGTLRLEWNGPSKIMPKNLVLGEIGPLAGAYFDLAGEKKGVAVPAGTYVIRSGLILKGSGKKAKSISIGTGASPKRYVVKAGEETVVKIGGPFKYKFEYQKSGGKLNIDGLKIRIIGMAGEAYMDALDAPPAPLVYVRKAGTNGKGRKVGSLEAIKEPKTFSEYRQAKRQSNNPLGLMDALLAPMDFFAKVPSGAVQIRLRTPRHPYFGKVESDWQ